MRLRKALYLGANPPGTPPLGLEDEVRAIRQELRAARYRCFHLMSYWASEASDLIRELREFKPTIVHLSGHACKTGEQVGSIGGGYRDAVVDPALDPGGGGLVLHARDGTVHVVSYGLVKKMFELAGAPVKLVVLTACGTEPLAAMLLPHVDCVIGIAGPISDHAALEFSKGLYAALGDGASVEVAFQAGCLAIRCAGLPDAEHPQLKVRDGVDASHVVLAAIPRRRKPRVRRGSGGSGGPRPARCTPSRGPGTRGRASPEGPRARPAARSRTRR